MQHRLLTQIRAVIFDMDGLMLDTEPLYKIAWQNAAVECGHPISEELYARLIGRTRMDGEEILRNEFGSSFSIDRFRDSCARSEAAAFAETSPSMKPGLERLLDLLEACRIPMAVATSTERSIARVHLARHGLLARFSAVATGDEVVNGKACTGYIFAGSGEIGAGTWAMSGAGGFRSRRFGRASCRNASLLRAGYQGTITGS